MTASGGESGAKAQLASYLASFAALGRARLAAVAVLVIVGTLAEGIGILLLIPLLGLIFSGLSGSGLESVHNSTVRAVLAPLPATSQLLVLLGVFVALMVLRAGVSWQRDLQLMRLSLALVDAWRARIVRAVAGASWQRLQALQNSRLEFAVNSEVGRLSIGGDRMLRGGVAAVQLLLFLAIALVLSPLLTLLALACGMAGVLLLIPLVRASHRYGEALSRDGSRRQNVFSEFLAGMKLAKVHDAERRYAGSFNALSDEMRERSLAYYDVQMRNQNAFQLAGGLAATVIVFVGIVWLHTAPVVLSALLALLTRIISPVQQLAQSAQLVLTMLPAVGNLVDIERSLASPAAPVIDRDPTSAATGPMAIALNSVDYQPPGRSVTLLRGLNLTIPAGSLVVLLGPSGSGKTTLADLLLGLLEPDHGEIAFDGQPIRDPAARAGIRRKVAYVPQESFLFDQTLRDNLLWAEPGASEAQLWDALDKAEAGAFVRGLPEGLDTLVGNRGSHLSGGERQRICLARALLRQPGLLILDEATSALDRSVEDRLLRTLARLRGQMTLLIIAHRLPDWLDPDLVLTLGQGVLTSRSQAEPAGIDDEVAGG